MLSPRCQARVSVCLRICQCVCTAHTDLCRYVISYSSAPRNICAKCLGVPGCREEVEPEAKTTTHDGLATA